MLTRELVLKQSNLALWFNIELAYMKLIDPPLKKCVLRLRVAASAEQGRGEGEETAFNLFPLGGNKKGGPLIIEIIDY